MPIENPLISVIVPVYNAERTIAKTLRSIIDQTYKRIQIIVIDDGSTDDSYDICNSFAINNSNIKVYHQENRGVIHARMMGISHLPEKGLTTFCDSDDRLFPNSIEVLFSLFNETQADVSCGTLVKSYGHLIKRIVIPPSFRCKKVFKGEEISLKLLPSFFGITDFPGYMHTKLYKNSLLKKSLQFETPVSFFQEDIAFNLQVLLVSDSIAVMPDCVYRYNQNGGTNHFMPSFLDDCIALCRFKLSVINNHHLSENLQYTTYVELKNELFSWLYMFYTQYHKSSNELFVKEIKRCVNLPLVQEAVSYKKWDCSGINGFRQAVLDKNIDHIYYLVSTEYSKNRIKRLIKGMTNLL